MVLAEFRGVQRLGDFPEQKGRNGKIKQARNLHGSRLMFFHRRLQILIIIDGIIAADGVETPVQEYIHVLPAGRLPGGIPAG